MHGVNDAFGDIGKCSAGLLGRHRTGKNPRADQEQALLTKQPEPVEKFLVRTGILQSCGQTRRELTPIRHGAKEARVDQAVHDLRLPRQHVAKPWGRAQDQCHQRNKVPVLAEQDEQPAAALQGLKEAVEDDDRVVGILGIGKTVNQRGKELDKGITRRLHPEHAIVAIEPLPYRRSHRDRFLESERSEMFDQARIVRPSRIIHLRQFRGADWIAFEELGVMPLDDGEMPEQVACKRRTVLITEKPRKLLHRLGIFGQRVGLLVCHHLQAVFDPPQEFVGGGKFVARLNRDPVTRSQPIERLQRRPHPQFGMPAAGNQLLGLREEFDLADAAAPDLDVVTLDRDFALPAINLHLPLHVVHVGQRGKIQVLAPDERRELRQQCFACLQVARTGPRLDHGGAFPGTAFALVIMQGGRG